AMRGRYGERLVGVTEASAAYTVIGEMLGELAQSHFRLFPPASDEEAAGAAAPPLKARWLDDALVVVDSGVEAVSRGAAIRAIGERSADDLVAQARARRPPSDPGPASALARPAAARPARPASGPRPAPTAAP